MFRRNRYFEDRGNSPSPMPRTAEESIEYERQRAEREKQHEEQEKKAMEKRQKIIAWTIGIIYIMLFLTEVFLINKPYPGNTVRWLSGSIGFILALSGGLIFIAIVSNQLYQALDRIINDSGEAVSKMKKWGVDKFNACKTELKNIPGKIAKKIGVTQTADLLGQKASALVNNGQGEAGGSNINHRDTAAAVNKPPDQPMRTINGGILAIFSFAFLIEWILFASIAYLIALDFLVTDVSQIKGYTFPTWLICAIIGLTAILLMVISAVTFVKTIWLEDAEQRAQQKGRPLIKNEIKTLVNFILYVLVALGLLAEIYVMNGRINFLLSTPVLSAAGKINLEDARLWLWIINALTYVGVVLLGDMFWNFVSPTLNLGGLKKQDGKIGWLFRKIITAVIVVIVTIVLIALLALLLIPLCLAGAKALAVMGGPALLVLGAFAICWIGRAILRLITYGVGIISRFTKQLCRSIFVQLCQWKFLETWIRDDHLPETKQSGAEQ